MGKTLGIPSKELSLTLVGPTDYFLASRVQRVEINRDIPSEDINEIGNNRAVGTVKDLPNITMTFSAMDVGVKIFSALTGTDASNYPAGGVDIEELGEVDAILYVKDDLANEYVKSAHARRMQVQDFTFSYTAEGNSTEDYTLIGSLQRWFKNDVVVDKFDTAGPGYTLSHTPVPLKNGDNALTVRVDGVYFEEVDAAPGPGEYTLSGTTLTLGETSSDQVLVVYQVNLGTETWEYVNDPSMPAAIRGRDAKVFIMANEIPRVQSITINGSLNSTPVRELGNRNIVGYQRQVATVTGTINVLDTDTQLMALLTTGDFNPSGITEFEPGVDESPVPIDLQVRLVDPNSSDQTPTLKTIRIPQLVIEGDSYTSNVNENAQITYNWRSATAQTIIYSGVPA